MAERNRLVQAWRRVLRSIWTGRLLNVGATVCGILGLVSLAFGVYLSGTRYCSAVGNLTLNEFGDFIAGTLGGPAALAAALFVLATLMLQRQQLTETESQVAIANIVALLPELRKMASDIPQDAFDKLEDEWRSPKSQTSQISSGSSLPSTLRQQIQLFRTKCVDEVQKVNALRETHLLIARLSRKAPQSDDIPLGIEQLMIRASFETKELDRRNKILRLRDGMIEWCDKALS